MHTGVQRKYVSKLTNARRASREKTFPYSIAQTRGEASVFDIKSQKLAKSKKIVDKGKLVHVSQICNISIQKKNDKQ